MDLARNDIGRIAKIGSVSVPRFMQVDRYSHVMHIVSEVEGELQEGLGPGGRAAGLLPGGHSVGRTQSAGDADYLASWSRTGAAPIRARRATSATTATWTRRSRSARS